MGSDIPSLLLKKKILCGEWIEEGKNWKLGNNIVVLYSSSLILNAFAHLHFIENKQKNLIPVQYYFVTVFY